MVTSRKAADVIQAESRLKRGGGKVIPVSAAVPEGSDGPGLAVAAADPDPAEAAAMAEGFDHMLRVLGNDQLRQIAVWKLEGYSNAEIADRLGKSDATVERKLKLIRDLWADAGLCG